MQTSMLKRGLLAALVLTATTGFGNAVRAVEPVPVVASFSILADMVREVGGTRVAVKALVGPDGDAHVYQPSPSDARALAGARLLVINGLDFEGWMPRLVSASGFTGKQVVATKGISPLKTADHGHKHAYGHGDLPSHGDADPHAWQSLSNARIYVHNIKTALIDADPDGAGTFQANADTYLAKIDELDAEFAKRLAALPSFRRLALTSHDAFGYFARDYGVTFMAAVGMSTDAEPSAAGLGRLIRQIKQRKVAAIFLENISDRRLLDRISQETGVAIGGTLHSDALSAPGGGADSYLAMMRHNLTTLATALAP